MMDPDFQLPAELMRRDVLSDEDQQKVKRKETYQERNDVLLNSVIQKKDASLVVLQLTDCLRNTDQDHVCNFIVCNGGKQTFFLVCFLLLIVYDSDSGWLLYITCYATLLCFPLAHHVCSRCIFILLKQH